MGYQSKKIENIIAWGKRKVSMQQSYERDMKIQDRKRLVQGNIYYVNFGFNLGHEIDKRRPAIVISNNKYNGKPNGLVVVMPLTKDVNVNSDGTVKYDTEFILRKNKFKFLKCDSTIMLEQIRTVSTRRIDAKQPIGSVDKECLEQITSKLTNLFVN